MTYTWNLKNKINKQIKQKHTHRHREHFDGCQTGGEVEGMDIKEAGLSTH